MAVIAEWRDIDELDPPAGAGEGRVHSARQFGPEELVVLRIDPQRRNPRRPAERGKGANQRILVADVIVGARTAASQIHRQLCSALSMPVGMNTTLWSATMLLM